MNISNTLNCGVPLYDRSCWILHLTGQVVAVASMVMLYRFITGNIDKDITLVWAKLSLFSPVLWLVPNTVGVEL